MSEPERSRDCWAARPWSSSARTPADTRPLCLQRLRYFLLFDETNPKAANRLYRAGHGHLAGAGLRGAVGLVDRSGGGSGRPTRFSALVTLFHTLVITSVRFRIPVEPMTFVWASLAVSPAIARMFQRRRIKIYRPGESSHDPLDSRHVLKGPHFQRAKKSSRPSTPPGAASVDGIDRHLARRPIALYPAW